MIKMHCFSWYSGSVHCHLTQIWNYSQRNTVDLGDSEWPNWRRRMTKSEEEGLLTIVTTFVSEIYFSMWFLESSCVDDSEYVPNLPAAMNIFFTTSVQSENLTFLGVRSTNPLPAASGLVKLTRSKLTKTVKLIQMLRCTRFAIHQRVECNSDQSWTMLCSAMLSKVPWMLCNAGQLCACIRSCKIPWHWASSQHPPSCSQVVLLNHRQTYRPSTISWDLHSSMCNSYKSRKVKVI